MSKITRAVQRTLAAHARRSGGRVRGYDEGGAATADDMIEQARERLATQPERMRSILPDVGEPVVGDGGNFSLGTRNGNRAADIGSRLVAGAAHSLATLPRRTLEASEARRLGDDYDPAPALETAMMTMGTGAGARGGLRPRGQAGYNPPHEPAAPQVPPTALGEASGDVGGSLAGAPGGGESLRQAQLQAQRRAGERQPLPGLPTQEQVVNGELFTPGPFATAHDVADSYMAGKDFGLPIPDKYHQLDTEHARAIAKAFEEMPHAPKDPQVKAAYEALAKETLDQYRAIKASGLKVTPVNAADYPYHGNPRAVAQDVADNNHMAFFKTDEGFGTNAHADPDHPLLRSSGEKVGEHDMLYNDLFRVVHDYFGHVKNGFGFRAAGEDNAWRAHAPMYSPLARRAMTTETRGQNSWLNHGPHGDFNRTANAADTIYSDQKVGLMPEWTMQDRVTPSEFTAYHASPHTFDQFKLSTPGAGEGTQSFGHGLYFSESQKVAQSYAEKFGRAGPSNIYETSIKAPQESFLDLERTVGEQPLAKQAFKKEFGERSSAYLKMTLQDAMDAAARSRGSKAITDALKEAGVPGVRYLDQGSRGGGTDQTRNYVVFDDKLLNVKNRTGFAEGGSVDSEGMAPENYEQMGAIGRGILNAAHGFADLPRRAIESSERMRKTGEYDPAPILEAASLPLGTGAIAGVPVRGGEMVLGSGALRRSTGVHLPPAKSEPRYYEHELNTAGNPIINKGVENPPNLAIQTVADPHRMMFPGIYGNPREIAAAAAARVGAEDPAMKRLFNVTRGDLREMAQGRVGNEEPALKLAQNPRGSIAAQNIQTPQNTQRLVDILGEAGKHEGLRTADAWYIQDPVFKRMKEMGSNDPAAQYRRFNTMTAMASPGSDVMTEIQRGTAAHWLHKTGRFGDFQKYAGVPEHMRSSVKFPNDMRYIGGHPYHRTSQGDPMAKYLEHGEIKTDAAKVPLYAHASGVPETGFQTSGPVGDAHFSRGVGLADTRKGPTDVGSSFSKPEYQTLQPWWQHDVAGKVGLESVPAQARLWTTLGPQTGVDSALGAPKLELLSQQIMEAARRLRISPEKARDLILSGKAGAGARGGRVSAFAEGGSTNFAPIPLPEYNVPLPSIAVENRGVGRPRLSGSIGDGDVSISGGYQHRDSARPAEWSTMVNYRKKFADGGALPPAPWVTDDAAPKKEPLPAAPWTTAAPAVPISGAETSAETPPTKSMPQPGPTLLETGKGAVRGPLSFLGDMGEAVMGPFGPSKHAANLYATITGGARPTPGEPYSTQLHKAAGVDSANPGYGGSIAETVTNPASWIGPGGPVAKGVVAAASGAGGQFGSDLTEGSPLGRAGGALLAGPLAARVIKPQLAPAQQTLADARVIQTPGQLAGGIWKNLEDKATSIPLLGHFITNARTRSVEGFNRSVGNQALEPIGGQIPAGTPAGHQMVAQVEHQLGAAYDRVVPHLQFAPDRQFAMEMLAIHQRNHGQLPPAQLEQFNRIISSSFGRGGNMTGQKIKTIEEELGKIGRNYSSSPMPAERDLGYAVTDTLRALRGNLERVNPQHADELQRINAGWAMYVRMRDAASRRVTSEGVFMPSDLLAAVKRGDRSAGKGSFARGDALMQDFAEAGQHVLPSKVPDSGTPGRALAAAATGALGGGHLAGYIPAKALAAIGAATQLYTRPSTWLLNQYTRPTQGVRAGYSAAGRGAGTIAAPLGSNPFGDGANPYAP